MRRRVQVVDDTPAELTGFDPDHWGRGDAGLDAWRAACLAWLEANPGRSLPYGNGGKIGVIRESIAMKRELWGFPAV